MTCVLMLLALCAAPVVFVVTPLWVGLLARYLPGEDALTKLTAASVYTIFALIYALGACLYLLLA